MKVPFHSRVSWPNLQPQSGSFTGGAQTLLSSVVDDQRLTSYLAVSRFIRSFSDLLGNSEDSANRRQIIGQTVNNRPGRCQ